MTAIDNYTNAVESRLSALSREQAAIFFAACTEHIMGFYQPFVKKDSFGNYEYVRMAQDRIWERLGKGSQSGDLSVLLVELEKYYPDTEKFDSSESHFAQYVCIGLEATLRLIANRDVPTKLSEVEFAIRCLSSWICVGKFGYYDFGGSEKQAAFEESVMNEDLVKLEIHAEGQVLNLLEASDWLTRVAQIKTQAQETGLRIEEVILR